MLVGTGEGIEQGGFTAVLITYQGKNHTASSFRISIRWASSPADGQFIPPDLNLNGIPHRRHLLHANPGFGISPMSNSRSRNAPSPPTAVMMPLWPILDRSAS